ncbi:hypothetical protein Tco_1380754, partial [Tanacetum coccineum]
MAMKGGRKNLKRDETLTLLEGQSIMQAVSLRGNNQIEPDEESTGSTSIHLEESSREPNAKRSVNSELGFPVCSSKSENHQEPSGSLSLTVHSPSTLKRHARPKPLCTHETDGDNPHNMEAYTLSQLRAIARERRLKCCSGVRKSVLLDLLRMFKNEIVGLLQVCCLKFICGSAASFGVIGSAVYFQLLLHSDMGCSIFG